MLLECLFLFPCYYLINHLLCMFSFIYWTQKRTPQDTIRHLLYVSPVYLPISHHVICHIPQIFIYLVLQASYNPMTSEGVTSMARALKGNINNALKLLEIRV